MVGKICYDSLMKRLAVILVQFPIAVGFLLFFAMGCIFLVIQTQKEKVHPTFEGESNEDLTSVEKDVESAQIKSPGSKKVTKEDEGGENVETQEADSGQVQAKFVAVSTPIAEKEECTSLEKYDPAREFCFYECESEEQCEEIEEQINNELEVNRGEKIEYQEADKAFLQNNREAVYSIKSGEVLSLVTGSELPSHRELWDKYSKISPDVMTEAYLSQLHIYNDSESLAGARLSPSKKAINKWNLHINEYALKSMDNISINALMIHIFGHLMTLNHAQVDYQAEESVCEGLFIDQGCANDDSYIQKFTDEFWSKSDIFAVSNSNRIKELSPEDAKDFVSIHATGSPQEDIAESFTRFIFEDKPTLNIQKTLQGSNGQIQEKIQFFYRYSELIKLRERLRQDLSIERSFERRTL